MKVTVLYGGPSDERDISLESGKAIAAGLRSMGHEVLLADILPSDLSALDKPADVIFPALHGMWGESGELQEILEQRQLPFVGSGSHASRLGINKVETKKVWQKARLPTPAWSEINRGDSIPALPAKCVVKAINSGSSIDVYICQSPGEAAGAVKMVLAKHPCVLVEQFIDGAELTVGLLEEQPLAPIRIVPKTSFFDYNAKYKRNDTEHRFDTGLPRQAVEHCRELARAANAAVGARDLARIDIMLDSANNPYLLEINTLPGFTSKSLLPEAAKHAGIEFGPLVDQLVRRAALRK